MALEHWEAAEIVLSEALTVRLPAPACAASCQRARRRAKHVPRRRLTRCAAPHAAPRACTPLCARAAAPHRQFAKGDASLFSLRGECATLQGRADEALSDAQAAAALSPTSGPFHAKLGAALEAVGRLEARAPRRARGASRLGGGSGAVWGAD